MVKSYFCNILLMQFVFIASYAQINDTQEIDDTKTLAYGITTNNYSGLLGGLVVRSSTPIASKKGKPVHRYISIEAVNLKNPRERNFISGFGGKFIYGKTNYLVSIRPEYGREFYIFPKNGDNSIGVSAIIAAGPSFGLLKPYYIKYVSGRGESPQTVPFNPDIHTLANITGGASIVQGLFKGTKVIPGVHFKGAVNLDMTTLSDKVTGFEIGTVLEFFSKEPEIITHKYSNNPQAFATVYLTLYFGTQKLFNKKTND